MTDAVKSALIGGIAPFLVLVGALIERLLETFSRPPHITFHFGEERPTPKPDAKTVATRGRQP